MLRVTRHLETSRFITISPFCSCESRGPERVSEAMEGRAGDRTFTTCHSPRCFLTACSASPSVCHPLSLPLPRAKPGTLHCALTPLTCP